MDKPQKHYFNKLTALGKKSEGHYYRKKKKNLRAKWPYAMCEPHLDGILILTNQLYKDILMKQEKSA